MAAVTTIDYPFGDPGRVQLEDRMWHDIIKMRVEFGKLAEEGAIVCLPCRATIPSDDALQKHLKSHNGEAWNDGEPDDRFCAVCAHTIVKDARQQNELRKHGLSKAHTDKTARMSGKSKVYFDLTRPLIMGIKDLAKFHDCNLATAAGKERISELTAPVDDWSRLVADDTQRFRRLSMDPETRQSFHAANTRSQATVAGKLGTTTVDKAVSAAAMRFEYISIVCKTKMSIEDICAGHLKKMIDSGILSVPGLFSEAAEGKPCVICVEDRMSKPNEGRKWTLVRERPATDGVRLSATEIASLATEFPRYLPLMKTADGAQFLPRETYEQLFGAPRAEEEPQETAADNSDDEALLFQ